LLQASFSGVSPILFLPVIDRLLEQMLKEKF